MAMGADPVRVRQQVMQVLSGYQGKETVGGGPEGDRPELRHGGLVECSFCGRRPPQSGRLVSGRDAYVCEHCIGAWSDRLATDEGESHGVATEQIFIAGPLPGAGDDAPMEIVVTSVSGDAPDAAPVAAVNITGAPDRPGIAALLLRFLADQSVDVDEVIRKTSRAGATDISFTVPEKSLAACLDACHHFREALLGQDGST
jgi:hypothetical protein